MKIFLMILVSSLVTIVLRFLPFWIFREREVPNFLRYLGDVLSYSIMGMLVVYCLRNITILSKPYGIPEAIAVILVALLQKWKRNTIISILGGTFLYMILIQVVF